MREELVSPSAPLSSNRMLSAGCHVGASMKSVRAHIVAVMRCDTSRHS
jgi:hypothetical protein